MKKLLAIALISSLASTSQAFAERQNGYEGQNTRSAYLRVFGLTLPPVGHVKFCEQNPAECRPKADRISHNRFQMTSHRWRELKHMNELVNNVIKPVTDKKLYGRLEHWTFPTSYKGDCEDYVLLKRQQLIQRGWPESSLLITVVLDENQEGHAVLTARTAQGDFILDNKSDEVLSWQKVPYTFIKRQSYRNPKLWVSLVPEEKWQKVTAVANEDG